MLNAPAKSWSSELIEVSPRPLSPEPPPESSLPSSSRIPKRVFDTASCDNTPPATMPSSSVQRPINLPGCLCLHISSPSRRRPMNARLIQTSRWTTDRVLADYSSVSYENTLSQKATMLSSYSSPSAQIPHGQANPYKLDDCDGKDEHEDDMPLGYPYKTFTDISMFAREYLCGMFDLVMTWLEERPGIRAST